MSRILGTTRGSRTHSFSRRSNTSQAKFAILSSRRSGDGCSSACTPSFPTQLAHATPSRECGSNGVARAWYPKLELQAGISLADIPNGWAF